MLCQAIDAQNESELREKLILNQINVVKCESCDYEFRVDTPMIYIDRARKVAILSIPTTGEIPEYDDGMFREHIRKINPHMAALIDELQIFMVLSHSELVERVFIIEAGMDVRIVEYVKYLIHTRNMDRVNPAQKKLLFNAQDSTDEKLLFIVQDIESKALEGVLEYKREAYQAFEEMFDDDRHTPDLFELFPGPIISAREALLEENPGQP